MTWVESASRSFRARHDSAARDDAERVLHSLELTRERLSDYFPTELEGLTGTPREHLEFTIWYLAQNKFVQRSDSALLTITVNGFSKSYAMTGWRLGYLAAPDEVAKAVDSIQSHSTSNPCSFGQRGALAALKDDEGGPTDSRGALTQK